jgi:hypothetical protein
MTDKEFIAECQRLERLGYAIIVRDGRTNTATYKKGRRIIQIGEAK